MNRGLHKTNIEIEMRKILKKLKINFVEQYSIRCRYKYIVDFYIPEGKVCIECDGEAWHPTGNRRDQVRDAVLKKMGFKVIRFRGQEILNQNQSILNRLNSIMSCNVL